MTPEQELADLKERLATLAEDWSMRNAVAYSEYVAGKRDAYETAAIELTEALAVKER